MTDMERWKRWEELYEHLAEINVDEENLDLLMLTFPKEHEEALEEAVADFELWNARATGLTIKDTEDGFVRVLLPRFDPSKRRMTELMDDEKKYPEILYLEAMGVSGRVPLKHYKMKKEAQVDLHFGKIDFSQPKTDKGYEIAKRLQHAFLLGVYQATPDVADLEVFFPGNCRAEAEYAFKHCLEDGDNIRFRYEDQPEMHTETRKVQGKPQKLYSFWVDSESRAGDYLLRRAINNHLPSFGENSQSLDTYNEERDLSLSEQLPLHQLVMKHAQLVATQDAKDVAYVVFDHATPPTLLAQLADQAGVEQKELRAQQSLTPFNVEAGRKMQSHYGCLIGTATPVYQQLLKMAQKGQIVGSTIDRSAPLVETVKHALKTVPLPNHSRGR